MQTAITKLLDEIISPPREFTPIPFWFLNDTFDKDELKRQLEDFHEKGVDGVILHPRIGIPKSLPYLSEEYFSYLQYIVRTAADMQMYIVLYDEAMYPSGTAHGEVVKTNPAFASVGITLTTDSAEGEILVSYEDGQYLMAKHCGGTIRGIHFGEDDGEADAPKSADILNPDAVDCFIRLTHDAHYEHLKEFFGTTIIAFFTDEPSVLGRNTRNFFEWTPGFEQEFLEKGGVLSDLRALYEHGENASTKLYHELITKRLNEVYYQKLSDWCSAHHIALMGHPERGDDIDEETYFHIPGQDLVFRRVAPEIGGLDGLESVHAKCSSDAARHTGKRRNANECFGVCVRDQIPWYLTADDMKWFIDWLGVRGVNLFVPHAFYYSIRDARKDERPPDVGPNNIWWEHYRLFSDYMKRISYIMTDSHNAAKTAVLCKSKDMPYQEVIPFYENQVEFNYLPLSLLDSCVIKDNKLCIAGYEYENILYAKEIDLPVPVIHSFDEVTRRDLVTDTPCKDLRVSHVIKNGIDSFFLVNEGNTALDFTAALTTPGTPIFIDLWNGTYCAAKHQCTDGKTLIPVHLKRHESLLILMDREQQISAAEPVSLTFLDHVSSALKLQQEDKQAFKKTYTAAFELDCIVGGEAIRFDGEEMAECYCNGHFAGVSFVNPHEFALGSYLKPGMNELKIVMTGNIANKYGNADIPYGIHS